MWTVKLIQDVMTSSLALGIGSYKAMGGYISYPEILKGHMQKWPIHRRSS